MIEASKTAELGSQPRKRRWKAWMIGFACVVAAAAIVLLATPPRSEPVKVRFVRATNEAGVKKLVFEGTNAVPGEIWLEAELYIGSPGRGMPEFYDRAKVPSKPGTNFYFPLKAPPRDGPYYVVWHFFDLRSLPTRWRNFRMGCWNFLDDHGMYALARPILPVAKDHYIPSSEIKE